MKKLMITAALLATSFSATVIANDRFAAGVHAGTLGAGIDVAYNLTDTVNIRGALNKASFNFDESVDDLDYDLDIDLQTGGLLFDWHPFASSFRVTAGAYINDNELEGSATSNRAGTVRLGNQVFTASDVGVVNADIKFNDVAPYLGVGWGDLFHGSRLSFAVDVGVMYQGTPDVDISAVASGTAPGGLQALLDAALDAEVRDLEDELDSFNLYPVVQIGLTYRF